MVYILFESSQRINCSAGDYYLAGITV